MHHHRSTPVQTGAASLPRLRKTLPRIRPCATSAASVACPGQPRHSRLPSLPPAARLLPRARRSCHQRVVGLPALSIHEDVRHGGDVDDPPAEQERRCLVHAHQVGHRRTLRPSRAPVPRAGHQQAPRRAC